MNVFEYLCLDNENKFRSKIVVNDDGDIKPVVVDSSFIENVMNTSSYDIVLHPVKVIRNPFYRDDSHWVVLCECRYPNNTSHKTNTRNALEHLVSNNEDIEISISQEFVLFEQDRPIGWKEDSDMLKNYTGKNEFSQYSDRIINSIIEALSYCGIPMKSAMMVQMIGKWVFSFTTHSPLEACDYLILFRFVAQKICYQNNIIFGLNPNPYNSPSCRSKCHFSISTPKMRDSKNGLSEIVSVCEKIKVRHLEQCNKLATNNLKKFTYSQKSCEPCVQIVLDNESSGFICDKRCGSDSDPYKVLDILLTTITSSYNINLMAQNLESLKKRYNYQSIMNSSTINTRDIDVITSHKARKECIEERSDTTATSEEKNDTSGASEEKNDTTATSEEKTNKYSRNKDDKGFAGLAGILNLLNDSDEPDSPSEVHVKSKTRSKSKLSRVDSIIDSLTKMDISHNTLNSLYVPPSKKDNFSTIDTNIGENTDSHGGPPPKSELYTLPSQL